MADKALCSIPECGKPKHQRGFCRRHHHKFWRYGDPLAGRQTMQGEPLRFLQETALKATDTVSCICWPYGTRRGYARAVIDGRSQIVSRYICELRNGPPPSKQHHAAHSCGNGSRGCVSPHHLVWKTPAENNADKVLHGTTSRGEKSNKAKLSKSDVREIRKLHQQGIGCSELGRRFGVSGTAAHWIVIRKTWAWLED